MLHSLCGITFKLKLNWYIVFKTYSVLKELVTDVLEEWANMGLSTCICVVTCIRVVFIYLFLYICIFYTSLCVVAGPSSKRWSQWVLPDKIKDK